MLVDPRIAGDFRQQAGYQLSGTLAIIEKTFLIAEPMGKVSWTKRCVAGGSGWPVELGKR
jgi:hypothetical protein